MLPTTSSSDINHVSYDFVKNYKVRITRLNFQAKACKEIFCVANKKNHFFWTENMLVVKLLFVKHLDAGGKFLMGIFLRTLWSSTKIP